MPSPSFYNQPVFPQANNHSPSFHKRLSIASQKIPEQAKSAYNQMTPAHQKEAQRKLSNLQRKPSKLASDLAKGKVSALIGLVFNMLRKIDLSKDWMFFIILIPFAFLKDIFDIVFAVVGKTASVVPVLGIVLGPITIVVGMTLIFVGEILLLCLTVIILILAGSKLRNRSMAKYIVGLSVTFISEAFPGSSWLPLSVIEAFVIYIFVLFDRTFEKQGSSKSREDQAESQADPAAETSPAPQT